MSNFATPVQPLQQQPQAALAPGQREYEATKRKYEEVLEPFIRPDSTMERMASFPAQKLAQTGKFKEASDCLDASLVAFSAPDEGSGSEGEDDGSTPFETTRHLSLLKRGRQRCSPPGHGQQGTDPGRVLSHRLHGTERKHGELSVKNI